MLGLIYAHNQSYPPTPVKPSYQSVLPK